MKSILLKSLAAICATMVMALPAVAVPITDLYNTGVDNAGNLLGSSVADSHYSITNPGFTATTISNSGFPIGTGNWIANNLTSRWIGTQNVSSDAPNAILMMFQTTFTIGANADLSTVVISGLGAADDSNTDTLVNGISVGGLFGGFGSLQAFNITSNFVIGTNTLDFVILNSIVNTTNPLGLRIDRISGTYSTVANNTNVPEPSVFILFALGLAGFGMRRLRTRLTMP